MPATLTDFQILRPRFETSQENSLQWLAKAHSQNSPELYASLQDKLLRIGLGPEKIERRGVVIEDCLHERWHEMEVSYCASHPAGASLEKRMQVYDRVVSEVFERFYCTAKLPEHLIHVTCTGYHSPSGAQKVVAKKEAKTAVTHAYHMGCYAAFPAVRMALALPEADIVHTELCTLHINPALHEMAQLVVESLFADGFIKYSVKQGGPGLQVLALHEEIIPNTEEAMSWGVTERGLKMTLSREVPVLIGRALPAFLETLRQKAGLSSLANARFAVHPGGPKIIEHVARTLNLSPWQISHSLEILKNYGNMSSATLPHVWEALWRDRDVASGTFIISLAFGPGLTLCGGIFQCGR